MRTIFAEYNPHRNSIDVYTSAGYMLRIDCWEAEKNLTTTPGSDCALNALAIDEPLEYARLYLDGTMQMWIDAEDSLVSLRGIFLPIVFFHLATFNCHIGAQNHLPQPAFFSFPIVGAGSCAMQLFFFSFYQADIFCSAFHIAAYFPPFASNSSWVPDSAILPSPITRI